MNHELPYVQGGFRKRQDHQKSKRVPGKHLLLLYWLCQSLWLCGLQKNCRKFLKRWDYQTCLLRNLCADQEATVKTGHGTPGWFQIGKGVCQGYILSVCLFNIYAECIRQNVRLDEAQAGIKMPAISIGEKYQYQLGEISITSDMQMTPPLWQTAKN